MKSINIIFICTILLSAYSLAQDIPAQVESNIYINSVFTAEGGGLDTTSFDESLVSNLGPLLLGQGIIPEEIIYLDDLNKYVVQLNDPDGNNMSLLEIDYNYNNITEIQFDLMERRRTEEGFGYPPIYNEIIFDNLNNHLYLPSGFHSQFQDVNFPERLSLRSGITWLSFPRLEREGNAPVDAVEVLTDRIEPSFIQKGSMTHNQIIPGPPRTQTIISIDKLHQQSPWDPTFGNLTEVQSTKGYKLTIFPEAPGAIELYGSRLDPSTSFPLYTDVENWIGYFLPYPQDVFDAFEPILDYVYSVKTQDWAIVRQQPPGGGGGPDDFLHSSYSLILDYGDLAVVEVMQDVPEFVWNNLAPPSQGPEIPTAENFSYAELTSYTPIYLELDTTENPEEIGAFVNDTCIGACVVGTDDSLAAILGYTGDMSGEITFQEYYGPTKSTNKMIDTYRVYEPELGTMVKRTIHTGEQKDYYLVSLKSNNTTIPNTKSNIVLRIIPNPCSDRCGLKYSIPGLSDVSIEVFNTFGIRLGSYMYKNQPAGSYKFDLNDTFEPGVYIIRLSACGFTKEEKLVITN